MVTWFNSSLQAGVSASDPSSPVWIDAQLQASVVPAGSTRLRTM